MSGLPQVKSDRGKIYTVLKALGQGQYGKVYLVVDDKSNEYAMKSINYEQFQMDAKKIQNLITEQNIMEIVDHPRILRLYDKIDNGKTIRLITTYCNGGNLEELILRNKKGLGEKVALNYLREMAEAFNEMQRHKIIHRDLKLANIFLHNNHIVIGDFGFAKLGVSATGSKLGTPYYMAPEILNQQNASKYNSSCDLWSIGVCYYFLVFGILPFDANSLGELKSKIELNSGEKLPFPKHEPISVESKRLLSGLLQKDPSKRWNYEMFFKFCGIKPRSDKEIPRSGSNKDFEEESTASDQGLLKSQLGNFNGPAPKLSLNNLKPETGGLLSQTRSSEQFCPYTGSPPQRALEKGGSQKDLARAHHQHYPTPINSFNTTQQNPSNNKHSTKMSFSISKMNESFAEEDNYGYICFKLSQKVPELDPYLYKINQIVFFFNVSKKLKDGRVSTYQNIKKSDLNMIFLFLEFLISRKTEIFIKDLKHAIGSKSNIFQLKNFAAFSNSKIYTDLVQVTSEFKEFIDGVFEVLKLEIDKEAAKYRGEFDKMKLYSVTNVETTIKEYCKNVWRTYSKYISVFTTDEKSVIMHVTLNLIYFCQDNLFPMEKFKNHKDWTVFNKFIDQRPTVEIEKEMTVTFNRT